MEEYTKLSSVVPQVPDLLLEQSSEKTTQTLDEILWKQRLSILIPIVKSSQYPTGILPPRENFMSSLHTPPENSVLSHVSPQQIQFITILVEFVHKNVQTIANAVIEKYKSSNRSEFYFLCQSAIPAFFGFFSSKEHISTAFSFYCAIIQNRSNAIAKAALLPFYCSPCTSRFIFSVYSHFGLKFCHDVRLDRPQVQKSVIYEYTLPFIQTIIQTFPLIPQQHQFLLRFMISSGWKPSSVLDFFLESFLFPQLLRYVKSTPFKNQFIQLKAFASHLDKKACRALLDIFENASLFEIPSGYEIFDLPFMQLFLTPLDVHMVIKALTATNEVPQILNPFIQFFYFDPIDFIPFTVKVYNRKPKPALTSYNWRPVVFPRYNDSPIDESTSPDFYRLWRQLSIRCQELGVSPLDMLSDSIFSNSNNSNNNSNNSNHNINNDLNDNKYSCEEEKITLRRIPIEKSVDRLLAQIEINDEDNKPKCRLNYGQYQFAKQLQDILGNRLNEFRDFVIERLLEELHQRSSVFETYLTHLMALNDLESWKMDIKLYYRMLIIPYCEESMRHCLSKFPCTKLAHEPYLINKVLEEGGTIFKSKTCVQLNYMLLIQHLLPVIFTEPLKVKLKQIEKMWQQINQEMRMKIKLPDEFHNKNNQKRALLLNQKLWDAIEHLRSIQRVQFASVLRIFLEGLMMLSELNQSDEDEDSVFQFAVVFSDSPILISSFLMINSFVIKQKRFHSMARSNSDLLIWCRFETTILKLLNHNPQLLKEFLSFQDQIIDNEFI